jgi:opacity protein-like surface antigen
MHRRIFGVVSSLMLCSSAFSMANDMENYPFYIPHFAYPVLSLSAGATFTHDDGKTQSIVDPVTHAPVVFNAHRKDLTNAIVGGFAGSEMFVRPDWHIQLGFGYNQPTAFEDRGTITPGGYAYSYSVKAHQALIAGKLLYNCLGRFHPYFAGGFGVSFLDAYDFTDPRYGARIEDHSNTSWTWNVGAGVDYNLTPAWRLGVGYRYNDFGRVDLGNAIFGGIKTSSTLKQNHFTASEVLGEISYIIY